MNIHPFAIWKGLAALIFLAGPLATGHAAEREKGYVPLFEGKTLAGWHETGTKGWTVRDGAIVAPGKGGGWLRSDNEYGDFILRLEYNIGKRGNSGVFVRAGTQGRTSRTGFEVQIMDDAGRKPTRHSTGSLYDMVPPTKNAAKPAGEWNAYEITARGSRVQIRLNGELVQDIHTDDPALNAAIAEQHKNQSGFPLLKDRRRRGYIGLQNHGDPVQFRNIRIMALNANSKMGGIQPATASPPITATWTPAGSVTLRRNNRTLATIQPGVFLAGWQRRTFTPGPGAEGDALRGTLQANDGASVAVRGRIAAEGDRLHVRYEMTPNAPVSVNSINASVSLPIRNWTGATWKSDAGTGTVPLTVKETALASGETRRFALAKNGSALTFIADSPINVLLQDNRVWGPGGDLEVRLGRQNGTPWTWPAGETETVAFTLDMGAPVTLDKERPVELSAGADWIPLDLKLDVAPKSALDFSFLNDGPAGRHGWIIATPEGRFAYEKAPKTPLRFYGVNLCFSANYPDHALADRLAERLARIGYNTVRIHHYEGELVDPDVKDRIAFRKESLDRLDYLFAALKKRGIYMKTDLYVSRPIPGYEMDAFKMATLVDDGAMANWKDFSKQLLEHVNPYTNLAYKDDPAMAWLATVNEPNAVSHLGQLERNPALKKQFEVRWSAWLRERYPSDVAVENAWGEPGATRSAHMPARVESNARGRDFAAFLTHLHERSYEEMSRLLRKEIGTKALLTSMNGWSEVPAFMAARTRFDWVDNHFYWDHPHFLQRSWQLPSQGGSGGGSAVEAGGAGPDSVAMTRLYGKPFSVSEYNYSAPNPYRAESGLLMGAASALQDWDAVWRFAYSHSRDSVANPSRLGYFDMATDPVQMASERAALLLYLRRDAAPSKTRAVALTSRDELMRRPEANPIPNLRDLTLVTQTGVKVQEENAKSTTSPNEIVMESGDAREALKRLRSTPSFRGNRTDLVAGIIESETGELFLDADRGRMRIVTPKTVGGIAREGDRIQAGPLVVTVEGARAAVWASSLDSRPVSESRRLLVVHATDVQNTGMRYSSQEMRVLEDWGRLPHLVRAGSAGVTLAHVNAKGLKAWRLDTSGNRIEPIPVAVENGRAALRLSTRDSKGNATLYYEIAAE